MTSLPSKPIVADVILYLGYDQAIDPGSAMPLLAKKGWYPTGVANSVVAQTSEMKKFWAWQEKRLRV